MVKKKILILGATGFVGRNMVERFAQKFDVMAASHGNDVYDLPGVHRCQGDLRDPSAVTSLIDGWKPDIIIQAAATTSGSKDIVNTPAIHVTDNAIMNSLIFRAAHEAKVKHVIFFSCTVMYGNGHLDEEAEIRPNDRYFGIAHTKLFCEKMCEFYSSIGQTKYTAIRHSNIFGAHDKYDLERSHLFGATIAKVEQATDKIVVWGNGGEGRDLLYVEDLVDFVEAALEKQTEKFGLYNCGIGYATRVNDLVNMIIVESGKTLCVEHDLSAPTIPTSLSLNCEKARQELGWEPKTSLEDGIRLTLDWYRKNKL